MALESHLTAFRGMERDEIVFIRHQVFTLEQRVDPKIDLDGRDETAVHVLVRDGGRALGTGRILEDGHMGRIAVLRAARGRGVGQMIVNTLADYARDKGLSRAWLGAQCQAQEFYASMGFSAYGDIYEEAGIDHIRMQMTL